MRDQQRHFAARQIVEAREHLRLGHRIQRGRRLVQDQHLRVAQISPRQREFLPLAAGKIDAALKTPAEHLIQPAGKASEQAIRPAFLRRDPKRFVIVNVLDPSTPIFMRAGMS